MDDLAGCLHWEIELELQHGGCVHVQCISAKGYSLLPTEFNPGCPFNDTVFQWLGSLAREQPFLVILCTMDPKHISREHSEVTGDTEAAGAAEATRITKLSSPCNSLRRLKNVPLIHSSWKETQPCQINLFLVTLGQGHANDPPLLTLMQGHQEKSIWDSCIYFEEGCIYGTWWITDSRPLNTVYCLKRQHGLNYIGLL